MGFRRVVALSAGLALANGAVACFCFVFGLNNVPFNDDWLKALAGVARSAQWVFIVPLVLILLNETYLWRRFYPAIRKPRWSDEAYAMVYMTVAGLAFFSVVAATALGTGATLSSLAATNNSLETQVVKMGKSLRALQQETAGRK